MKKNRLSLAIAITLVAGIVWAASEVFTDQGSSLIRIESTDHGQQIENKEVRYITNYLGDYTRKMLLKVTTTVKYNTGEEGSIGESTIEARSENDLYKTPVWTVTDNGQEVFYLNDYLIRSVSAGCCGDFTRSKVYDVETGKSPATYLDNDFYTITVPNSGLRNRYMAQIEDLSAPKTRNGKDYVGSVAYFEDTRVLQTVRFYVAVPAGWGTQIAEVKLVNTAGSGSKNEFRDKELELWDSDGNKDAKSAFKGFAMTGTIDFDQTELNLTVPVVGDQIDEVNIKVSPGLEFEVLH